MTSKRDARRAAGGWLAFFWALAILGSALLTIALWVALFFLALAGIHYLNTH